MSVVRPAVLLAAPVTETLQAMLQASYEVIDAPPGPQRLAQLRQLGSGVRAAVVSGSHGLDAVELAALPDLQMVAVFGVGLDALDLDHLQGRGVQVATTPVLAEDVADLAVALWLATVRQVPQGDRFVHEGGWAATGRHPLTRRASGRVMGVFGFGRIGQAIARRAQPFAREVLYHSRRSRPETPFRHVPTLLDLAQACEVLFVAAPGGAETRGVINAAVLDALGPDGVLVNVARGSLVDEPALAAALREGRIGGAGLDVVLGEPNVAADLLAAPQLVLSPHAGSATVECRLDMAEAVMANLRAFFEASGADPRLA